MYLTRNIANETKSTIWRINANILNKTEVKDTLKLEIQSYLEYNDNGEVSPVISWLYYVVRS